MTTEITPERQLALDYVARALPVLPIPGADLPDVQIEEVAKAIVGGTAGIWRVSAHGRSFVVKLLRCGTGGDPRWRPGRAQSHWYYWRREGLVYGSGILEPYHQWLRAPQVNLVDDASPQAVAIWMEDVPGSLLSRGGERVVYADVAYRLGAAQARYIDASFDRPWLSHGWLRSYLRLRRAEGAWLKDEQAWKALSEICDLSVRDAPRFQDLWNQRHRNVALLASAPQTLSHFDMHLKNILVDGGDRPVLVDWSFAGVGAIGEDAGNLYPDCVLDFHAPPVGIDEAFSEVARSYAAGLRHGGAGIHQDQVRQWMAAATAAKYSWIVPAMLMVAAQGRPTLNGRPAHEAAPVWASTAEFLCRLQAELS